jgi:hypothetical protein
MNPDALRVAFDREKRWYKKVLLIDMYHCAMILTTDGWKVSDTAMFFNISVGAASEAITLSKAITEDSRLTRLSRNKALQTVRSYETAR